MVNWEDYSLFILDAYTLFVLLKIVSRSHRPVVAVVITNPAAEYLAGFADATLHRAVLTRLMDFAKFILFNVLLAIISITKVSEWLAILHLLSHVRLCFVYSC